jgi:hypothetical protein
MAPQVEKTWTRFCESKRPRPKVPPFCEMEGAKCLGNPGSQQLEVGGHCAHPAATAGVAALERTGRATWSRRPLLQPCLAVVVVVVVAIHYH